MIDAKEVSAAHRARYFWGNLPGMNRLVRVPGMGGTGGGAAGLPAGQTAQGGGVQPRSPLPKGGCSDMHFLLFKILSRESGYCYLASSVLHTVGTDTALQPQPGVWDRVSLYSLVWLQSLGVLNASTSILTLKSRYRLLMSFLSLSRQ